MSSSGSQGISNAMLSAKQSVISNAIIGKNSLFAIRGHTATTPIFQDPTVFIYQTNGVIAPTISTVRGGSSELVFALPKNSTLIGDCYIEYVLTAGTTTGGGAVVEYQKNCGDRICELVTVQYGNTQLQRYNSDFQVFFRRLCKNDVNIEATNVNVLGNLPPSTSATGTEAVLRDAFLSGVTLTTPLEELFWVHRKDEAWMPESLALEGQLRVQLAAWPDLLITSSRDATVIATYPTCTSARLRYQEYTLSAAEKENRLKIYKTPQGMIQKFLDLEVQTGFTVQGSGAARAAYAITASPPPLSLQPDLAVGPIQLNNLRLDMAEIVFCVRRLTNSAPADLPQEAGVIGQGYAGSQYESNPSSSLVWAGVANTVGANGRSISTEIQVRSFSLAANGKTIFTSQPDLYNRSYVRKYFHPDAQVADPVYCIPLAFYPEDRTNATGHLSASVLGNLTLTIVLANPGPAISYQVDVFSHSHNILQSRAGGITKALF